MAVTDVLAALPPAMQEQVEGYARFVTEVSDEVFLEQQVPRPTPGQRQTLLTLAVAWKLWRSIDSQYTLLNNSLNLLGASGVSEIAAGGNSYYRGSATFGTLRRLRVDFLTMLGAVDLSELTRLRRLSEVVQLAIQVADQ